MTKETLEGVSYIGEHLHCNNAIASIQPAFSISNLKEYTINEVLKLQSTYF